MDGRIILALVALGLVLLSLTTAAICFFKIFYRQKEQTERYPIPPGEIYEAYRDQLIAWMMEIDEMPHEDVEIKSFDGLTLRGRYYEYKKGAPTEILFHGYRGTSYRDLCGGVYRTHALGRNALIVDHRASGRSEGKIITFGARESRDILSWVEYFVRERDPDARIIITGISMGAASVLTASGYPLPKNVVGILADCGYTSTKEIIKKVIRDMKLPANILYPFVRLGAILFGRFDPNGRSAID
ncbi:MAG: alpha/beta hydrolase, partial [Clostridia bacterium]|nr:alpha/beta hydrolase [Clostridia bacterium]